MELYVVLPMAGGIITILGAILLLYKGKIAFDEARKPVILWETRWFVIKATSASLALFIVGAILLIFPLWLVESSNQKLENARAGWEQERQELVKQLENARAGWEQERQELVKQIENPKTVMIQGLVKADNDKFPVVIYAANVMDALQKARKFTLQVPVFKNIRDYEVICTTKGNQFTSETVPRDNLLASETLAMQDIEFPTNHAKGMSTEPKDWKRYHQLEPSSANEQPTSQYDPSSN